MRFGAVKGLTSWRRFWAKPDNGDIKPRSDLLNGESAASGVDLQGLNLSTDVRRPWSLQARVKGRFYALKLAGAEERSHFAWLLSSIRHTRSDIPQTPPGLNWSEDQNQAGRSFSWLQRRLVAECSLEFFPSPRETQALGISSLKRGLFLRKVQPLRNSKKKSLHLPPNLNKSPTFPLSPSRERKRFNLNVCALLQGDLSDALAPCASSWLLRVFQEGFKRRSSRLGSVREVVEDERPADSPPASPPAPGEPPRAGFLAVFSERKVEGAFGTWLVWCGVLAAAQLLLQIHYIISHINFWMFLYFWIMLKENMTFYP